MTTIEEHVSTKPKIKVVPAFEPARFTVEYAGEGGPLHTDIPSAMREAVAIDIVVKSNRESIAVLKASERLMGMLDEAL